MNRVDALADATPSSRDRYVDFLRVASLAGVILGHFFLATVYITGVDATRQIHLGNLLELFGWARAGTWVLQVMPVFFIVGGFAHAVTWRSLRRRDGGYADFVRARVSRLVAPALAFATVGMVVGIAIEACVEPSTTLNEALQIAPQLLWFIGIYLGIGAFTPLMLRLHERFGAWVLAWLGSAVVAVDIARFAGGVDGIKWTNFLFVWLAVHQMGFFYADGMANRHENGWTGRRFGWAMLGLGATTAAVLVAWGPYGTAMVSYPGEKVSNMTPPTIVLLALAVAQAGVLLLLRPRLTRWLEGRRPWRAVIAGGAVAMTAFLWHFVALMCLYGLLLLAAPSVLVEPGTLTWWVWKLPLFLAFLALVAVFVAVFRVFDRPARGPAAIAGKRGWRTFLAVGSVVCAVLGMLGFTAVGFRGILDLYTAKVIVLPMTGIASYALVVASAVLAHFAVRSPHAVVPAR